MEINQCILCKKEGLLDNVKDIIRNSVTVAKVKRFHCAKCRVFWNHTEEILNQQTTVN